MEILNNIPAELLVIIGFAIGAVIGIVDANMTYKSVFGHWPKNFWF